MKKIIWIMLVVISITFCGCWSNLELNELNILYGISMDLTKDNKYIITLEGISPIGAKEQGDKKSKVNYYTSMGDSIFDAARNMTKTASGKRTFYQSCQAVIIGQNLCEASITPVIDFFTRDHKRRATIYPVIFEGNILDLPFKKYVSNGAFSNKLIDIIKLYDYTGYSVNMNLSETICASKGIANTVLINKFKIDYSKNLNEPVFDGTGVFYKNKLIGSFNSQETMIANIVSRQIKKAVLVVNKDNNPLPISKITIEFSKFKTKFIPNVKNGNYIMNVDINATGKIAEYSETDSLMEYDYEKLESIVAKNLTELINKTYLNSKTEFKVDALGFGEYFSKKYKNITKMKPEEWNEIFANNFDLKLNVKASIVNTGTTVEKSD